MTNITDLPDWDDMMNQIDIIRDLNYRKLEKETYIKSQEARTVLEASTKEAYLMDGKRPSMEFIKNGLLFGGLDGNLVADRIELAVLTASLEEARNKLDLMKAQIDIWKAENYQKKYESF
jgi:hypothetical protein